MGAETGGLVTRLAQRLGHGDLDSRLSAVTELAAAGEPGATVLGEALKIQNTLVAFRAARALAGLGSVTSEQVLASALASADEWTRLSAAVGLASVRDERALGPLRQALDGADADQHPYAVEGLVALGTPEAVATIHALALSDGEPVALREQATLALGRLHDQRSHEILVRLQSSRDRRVRRAAQRALTT